MNWSGATIVVVGAARQGVALARYLVERGAKVVLNDQRLAQQLATARESLADLPVKWVLGGHPLDVLDGADLVCPSGGVPLTLPLIQEAVRRGIRLSNDSQIFLDVCPCRVIGITGSAGKTTTTSLVGQIAQQAAGKKGAQQNAATFHPRQVWVGGNIGSPLLAVVDQMQPDDLAVMELSSFQLEIMTRSTHVAAILNITPNHLDRHESMESYTAAKKRLLDYQTPADVAVLGRDDPGAWNLAGAVKGSLVTFGMDRPLPDQTGTFMDGDWVTLWDRRKDIPLLPRTAIQLRGQHNLQNVLASCAISTAASLPAEAMQAAVSEFLGVPHRLELVRRWGGAAWYNDSIATAPERAMAGIRSFDEPIVLLAGGRDKDLPWDEFANLIHERVDHVILFGDAAGIIELALGTGKPGERPFTVTRCSGLKQAVDAAAQVVRPGDVVLLAPGGTSFDEFRDFEERGEAYRRWVLDL